MDNVLTWIRIPAPELGLWDGYDPALEDGRYPATASPDLQNCRVTFGKWEPRLGQSLWKTSPSSGRVRLFETLYTSSGNRHRLLWQGDTTAARLFKLTEGTDTVFQPTTSGTGLGGATYPRFTGLSHADLFYFSDRAGALRKWTPGTNTVTSVTQVAAPAAAPLVKPRTYAILEDWSSLNGTDGQTTGWSSTDSSDLDIDEVSSTEPPPGRGNVARIRVLDSTGSKGDTLTDNVQGEDLNSHTIAFWYRAGHSKGFLQVGLGLTQADEFVTILKGLEADEWEPVFIDIGNLPEIHYKRIKCIRASSVQSHYFSRIYLPGRLEGAYRWRVTHYNPTTLQESAPSSVTGGGEPVDLSALGITGEQTTARAFEKSAMLSFDTTTAPATGYTLHRVYRNGGVPALTKNSRGLDVWHYVGQVTIFGTLLNGAHGAGVTTLTMDTTTGLASGDWLVIDRGTDDEEDVQIDQVTSGTQVTLLKATVNAHADNADVRVGFLDNVANEQVDLDTLIEVERDSAPSAAKFMARTPEGRLVLFNYTDNDGSTLVPNGFAISNKPTPQHPLDYEVFPRAIDPLTRRSAIQGWRAEIGGEVHEDAITWGGVFQGLITILTRKSLYLVDGASQLDWGPQAIRRVALTGCIAGDTVAECNGYLYWVTDGPQVVRWDGRSAPQMISDRRVALTLMDGLTDSYDKWFAVCHTKRDGDYYCLYMTPSTHDSTVREEGCTLRLDYNATGDRWEPIIYHREVTGSDTTDQIAFQAASVWDCGADVRQHMQVARDGRIYECETGNNDDGTSVKFRARTKRMPLGLLGLVHEVHLRLEATADDLTVIVRAGGSEYGDQSQTFTVDGDGSGDREIKLRVNRTMLGRWVQVELQGEFAARTSVREVMVGVSGVRQGRYSA